MQPEQVEAAIRPKDPHSIQTALICLENTHNSGGGTIYPLATIERIRAVASAHGMPMHLDGARLFNAVAATTLPPAAYAQHFETVSRLPLERSRSAGRFAPVDQRSGDDRQGQTIPADVWRCHAAGRYPRRRRHLCARASCRDD